MKNYHETVLYQRLRCSHNDSCLVVTQVISLPSPPHYGLTLETELPQSMISHIEVNPTSCSIFYNTNRDFYRIQFKDFLIDTEKEMEDLVERYKFHGWKVELAGATTVTVDEKSGYAKKGKKKNPFTLIPGGRKED